MNRPDTLPSKVTTTHRAKLAYVYVRQSSLSQVMRQGESTELQYRLVEHALALGWPRERVQIIDDDLGKSGTGTEQRQGLQQLMAEIGLARVGLVISLDASRLARNNSGWHRLIAWSITAADHPTKRVSSARRFPGAGPTLRLGP